MTDKIEGFPDINKLIARIESLIGVVEEEAKDIKQLLPSLQEIAKDLSAAKAAISQEAFSQVLAFDKVLDASFLGPVIEMTENAIGDFKAVEGLLSGSRTTEPPTDGTGAKARIKGLITDLETSCEKVFETVAHASVPNPLSAVFAGHRSTLEAISDGTCSRLDRIVSLYCPQIYNCAQDIDEYVLPWFEKTFPIERESDLTVTRLSHPFLAFTAIAVLQTYVSAYDELEKNFPTQLDAGIGAAIGVEIEGTLELWKAWIVWTPIKVVCEVLLTLLTTYADLPD